MGMERTKNYSESDIPKPMLTDMEEEIKECKLLIVQEAAETAQHTGSDASAHLTIPAGVTMLGTEYTPAGNTGDNDTRPPPDDNKLIAGVTIPDSVTEIGYRAFYGYSGLKTLNIPNSVTKIGRKIIEYCDSLTSLTIPDSVTEIGGYAFYPGWYNERGSRLTSIRLSKNLRFIGEGAFSGCNALTSIAIPDGVKEIGEGLFEYCINLERIEIGKGVEKIALSAFHRCDSLREIKVHPDNLMYADIDGVLVRKTPTWIPNARRKDFTSPGGRVVFCGVTLNAVSFTDRGTTVEIGFDDPDLKLFINQNNYKAAIEVITDAITAECKKKLAAKGKDPATANSFTSMRMNLHDYPEIKHAAGNIDVILSDTHIDDSQRLYEVMDIYEHVMTLINDEKYWRETRE